MHTCIHTYMHTYMHTYIHTCIHTCMHTCIHTCIHECIHTCIQTCIHTCIHIYMYTYMYTCTHTYIHTYIHKCIHTCIHTCLHTYISSDFGYIMDGRGRKAMGFEFSDSIIRGGASCCEDQVAVRWSVSLWLSLKDDTQYLQSFNSGNIRQWRRRVKLVSRAEKDHFFRFRVI